MNLQNPTITEQHSSRVCRKKLFFLWIFPILMLGFFTGDLIRSLLFVVWFGGLFYLWWKFFDLNEFVSFLFMKWVNNQCNFYVIIFSFIISCINDEE